MTQTGNGSEAANTAQEQAIEALMRLIAQVTAKDMARKSLAELFASVVEEVGEVSRAMLVEQKTFGHSYKRLDESACSECVDVLLSALGVYFAVGGKVGCDERISGNCAASAQGQANLTLAKLSRDDGEVRGLFKMLSALVQSIGKAAASVDYADWYPNEASWGDDVKVDVADVCDDTLQLFFAMGGTIEDLLSIGNAKMDKWAASQH